MNENIGRHWVLLRGLVRESAHWGDFIPQLKTAFPESTITTLDLPGTGSSYQQISPAHIGRIVDCVRQKALKQGLNSQPFTLLALSLGGMVGWEWMLKYPQEINGACLINMSFAGLSPCYQRLRWQSMAQLLNIVAQRNVAQRERSILRLVSNCSDYNESIIQSWTEIAQLRPISANNKLSQIMAAFRYRPGHQKPHAPVLLLSSQTDRLVASACSDAIQRKWELPLISHPWAGHDLPLDDGAWVISQLQDWLSKNNANKSTLN